MLWRRLIKSGVSVTVYPTSVSLMLHMDGSNNGTTFEDSSQTNAAITRAGTSVVTSTDGAYLGSAQAKYTGSGYLSVANNTNQNFGTGDFCIDFFLTLPASYASYIVFFSKGVVGAANTYGGYVIYSGGNSLFSFSVGAANLILNSTIGSLLGTRTHIELSRTSGRLYLFVGGVKKNDLADTTNVQGGTNAFTVGANGNATYPLAGGGGGTGYMDEFRMQKGVGGHIADFTPPTAPY